MEHLANYDNKYRIDHQIKTQYNIHAACIRKK